MNKNIIKIILCILIFVFGITYSILFITSVYQQHVEIKECEDKGLVLVYPPFEKPSMRKPCYCGNLTELSKIHKMETTLDGWAYWDNEK